MILVQSAPSANPAPTGRAELARAARGFEAIFVRQMLAAARKTSFDNGLFGSEANDTFRQMQDDRFAEIAADSGAFGLGRMIEARLAAQVRGS
jgi:peptidoglycan hydrolase FlgJ